MPYFGPHKLPATNSICHLQHFVSSLVEVFFLQQLNITFSERVLAVNGKQQILNLVTDKLESIAVRFGFFPWKMPDNSNKQAREGRSSCNKSDEASPSL